MVQTDLEYFTSLWGKRSSGCVNHSPELWDNRASEWIDELCGESDWANNMRRRVSHMAQYLRSRGLLGSGDAVIDVGCGPGLFVVEFAKTALHVTGLDYSRRFAGYAAETAQSLGLRNTSFEICDFLSFNVKDAGYIGAFDLVFTSNSPAASARGSLEKLMSMSRAYCFNTSIIHATDSLLERISLGVFGETYHSRWDGGGFYSLLNLLWLMGYYPETAYYCEAGEETVSADINSAAEYAQLCGHTEPGDAALVLRYLESTGDFTRRSEHRYGSILWDVRTRDER